MDNRSETDAVAQWKENGKTIFVYKFKFFNRLQNEFQVCDSLESVRQAHELEAACVIENSKQLFSVVHVSLDAENNGVWRSVNIDSAEEDGQFQVFDQQTGQHILVNGKAEALSKRNELLTSYCQFTRPKIFVNYIDENGVVSSDWEPLTA